MKRFRPFTALVIMLCMLASLTSISYADEYTITTPYEYPVTPLMEEWKEFDSHIEMIEACQIPDNILKHLSTPALAETVANYPLLSDMLAWSDKDVGVQSVASNFNGLEELLSRENGIDYLLATTPMLDIQNSLIDADEDNFMVRNKIRCIALIANSVNGRSGASTYSLPVIETGDIRTPNGRLVPYYKDLTVIDLINLFGTSVPFTQNEFDDLEAEYALNYPQAVKIGSISPSYNCHSYAWYSTASNNRYWITDINPYLLDGSYEGINYYLASSGDKALYVEGTSTITHSARVNSFKNDHLYLTSKWAFMGVYSHRDDYCPYATNRATVFIYTRT